MLHGQVFRAFVRQTIIPHRSMGGLIVSRMTYVRTYQSDTQNELTTMLQFRLLLHWRPKSDLMLT
jgi:hypothetical protein